MTYPGSTLSRNFYGFATISQHRLVLHDEIFLETCLAMLEREIHCKLQMTCETLQPLAATCNVQKNILAMVAKSRTNLYFVQSLQAQKDAKKFAKRTCYTLQPTCNLSCNAIQHKLQRNLHLVTPAVELCSIFDLQRL